MWYNVPVPFGHEVIEYAGEVASINSTSKPWGGSPRYQMAKMLGSALEWVEATEDAINDSDDYDYAELWRDLRRELTVALLAIEQLA